MQRENIQAIYPLLEMQQGFLFNHQLDPRSGSLLVRCELSGHLDPKTLQAAWDEVLRRHEMLRCSVHTRQGKPPMLVVWKEVVQPIQVEEADDASRIVELEQQPLPLDQAPIGSLHLLPMTETRHKLVWQVHHIVLDGWSAALVLREVVALYNQKAHGVPHKLLPPGRYQDFMAFRRQRNTKAECEFWQRSLAGFNGTPRWPTRKSSEATPARPGQVETVLNVEESNELARLATEGITANAVASGCWALVQATIYDSDDVVTGVVTSGRASDVRSIESLVGLVANTIPVRTEISHGLGLGSWLRRLRDEQFELQSFEMASIDEIQSWCKLPDDRALCESLLVVENFPTASGPHDGLHIERFESGIISAYPLTICVVPGETWKLKLLYDDVRVTRAAAEGILEQLIALVRALSTALEESVSEFAARHANVPRMEAVGTRSRGGFVAPRTEVQKRLSRIWKKALGRDVGVRTRFFDAGGRSLTAVRMLAAVEEEFGQQHSPGVLMQHPTIEDLAEVIAAEQTSSDILVRFPSANEGTVVVCAHAGGEHAIYYRFLANHLAQDHPVVAFQSEGLQGGVPKASIEALAAANVEQLLSEFPDQPVCLVGYCAGASVAVAMAGQLERLGHSVRGLVIVDSSVRRDARFLRDWAYFKKRGPKWLAAVRFGMYQLGLRPLKWALEDLRLYAKGTADGRREFYRRRVERATMKAISEYQPHSIEAPVHLVRSSSRIAESECDRDVNYLHGLSAKGFTQETLDVDHREILLEPTVEQVAASVRAHLQKHPQETVSATP